MGIYTELGACNGKRCKSRFTVDDVCYCADCFVGLESEVSRLEKRVEDLEVELDNLRLESKE